MDGVAEALVLGIGNVLWADEGFGVRCVEAFAERYEVPEGVRLLDGGTQGMYLVHEVTSTRRLLVFDAVDWGDPPGTLRVVRDEDVPRFCGVHKTSLHQTGFQEVLAAADLLGKLPEAITLIGVQPERLDDYGGGLTAGVAAQIDAVLFRASEELAGWGIEVRERQTARGEPLVNPALRRDRYEGERPGPDVACRIGDDRFF